MIWQHFLQRFTTFVLRFTTFSLKPQNKSRKTHLDVSLLGRVPFGRGLVERLGSVPAPVGGGSAPSTALHSERIPTNSNGKTTISKKTYRFLGESDDLPENIQFPCEKHRFLEFLFFSRLSWKLQVSKTTTNSRFKNTRCSLQPHRPIPAQDPSSPISWERKFRTGGESLAIETGRAQ